MSLDHILLGMLSEPAAGYDLGREFEESARLFWFAELSQIYPTLKRLEGRGWLRSHEEPSPRGPARRVYERTEAGTAELEAWLREPPELETSRLPYVAKLYFLGQLDDPEASRRFVEALKAELGARLATYRAIEKVYHLRHGERPEFSAVEFHRHAALRAGIHVVRARLAWCEETLAALAATRRSTGRLGGCRGHDDGRGLMDSVFDGTRWIHIVVGFAGLIAFWIPAFARKGSDLHVRVGKVFEWSAYVVAGTAIFNSIGRGVDALLGGATLEANRSSFGFLVLLAYLGIVTLASVRHGVLAVRVKNDFEKLRTPFHIALAVSSVVGSVAVLAYALVVWTGISVVLLVLSPIGVGIGYDMISQMRHPPGERMAWFYRHMGNIIGAGIAFHTAFLVFGSSRFVPFELPGLWQVVPWVLPAAIGIPLQRSLETRYRRKFGEPRGGRRPGATDREEAVAST